MSLLQDTARWDKPLNVTSFRQEKPLDVHGTNQKTQIGSIDMQNGTMSSFYCRWFLSFYFIFLTHVYCFYIDVILIFIFEHSVWGSYGVMLSVVYSVIKVDLEVSAHGRSGPSQIC